MEARLSTYKTGHGPDELFTENLEQFWHTDGNLPHYIEIEFPEIKRLMEIRINLGHAQDKSYIPKEIEIRCGKTRDTINSLKTVLISDKMPVVNIAVNEDCCFLQIIILSNHQEGRDSRVRGLALTFLD